MTLRVRTGEIVVDDIRRLLPNHAELSVRERATSLEDVYLDLVEEGT